MSDTKYTIEHAKSARATCRGCRNKIDKNDLRIGAHTDQGEMKVTQWYHVPCFKVPRKYTTGANKMTPQDFCANVLHDETNESILQEQVEEIAEQIASKGHKGGDAAADTGPAKSSSSSGTLSLVEKLRQKYNAMENSAEDKPPAKKAKTNESKMLEIFAEYHDKKKNDLSEILEWNLQQHSGNKDVLLARLIDGLLYGRLARCTLCQGGRLKLQDDSGEKVICNGKYDENLQLRLPCSFQVQASEAPRWQPFYTEEPTAEEKSDMQKLDDQAKEGGTLASADTVAGGDPSVALLVTAAEAIDSWDLQSKAGIRQANQRLIDILQQTPAPKKLSLPENASDIQRKVGEVLLRHRDKSAAELVPILVQEFGFAQDKEAAALRKVSAVENMTKCSANVPLLAALQELAEWYFKEDNRNAGNVYIKGVEALQNLDFAVTAENAKGLGKGKKTKVANIGPKIAEYMHEFVTTGTIAKLDEKRAAAS